MAKFFRKPINAFLILFIGLNLLFFLFPINLFDGEIIIKQGLQTIKQERPLSLSYFIGVGYDESDMDIIKDFYLLPKGYMMAFLFVIGIPALVAYRVSLGNKYKTK